MFTRPGDGFSTCGRRRLTRRSTRPRARATSRLFRPCSGRRRSAPPNDTNQRALKSQLNGIVAGTVTSTKSSSCTHTMHRVLLAACWTTGSGREAGGPKP